MKWEEMSSLERNRQFKQLKKLFYEALKEHWGEDFAEYQTVFEPLMPDEIDHSKIHGGYGRPTQIISDGEWSLICALRRGTANGR